MATEITEFGAIEPTYGVAIPVPQLPPRAHTKLAVGASMQFNAETAIITILPDEKVRVRIGKTAAAAAGVSAADMPLTPGVLRDFRVPAGWYLQTIAG